MTLFFKRCHCEALSWKMLTTRIDQRKCNRFPNYKIVELEYD